MFDFATRHQQAMLEVKAVALARHLIDQLLYSRSVFGMSSIQNEMYRRLRRAVESEDVKAFLGPQNVAGRHLPSEAPCAAQPLRFGKIGFAAAKLFLGALPILNVDAGPIPLDDFSWTVT